jgi:hypothetical protein
MDLPDVHTRIASLEAELESLKARLAPSSESPTTDRRGLVKLLAAGAVGAVGGAVALSSQRASAADGMPVLQGAVNNAISITQLIASDDSALFVDGAFYGLVANGSAGNALFIASGPSPPVGGFDTGALWVDGTGTWWICVEGSATSAVWRSIGGPASAGQLNLLPAPRRAYDSRPGATPGGGDGPLLAGGSRPINLTIGTGVPPGVSAALISLTVTRTAGSGFLGVFSNAVGYPGHSNINWTAAGQDVAVTTVTAVDATGTCRVQNGPNGTTDLIFDVIGYYI